MKQQERLALEKKILKEYQNITGLVCLKNGETVYENYFSGCTAASRVHVYSVTKSIISILIGIAADKGCIQSLDEKILDFFPEYEVKSGEGTLQKITIKHLLTMTAPYKYRLFPPYKKYFMSDDWVKFALGQAGGRGRIGDFRYAPLIGPDILSGILVKATGMSVFDFAAKNLFSPLDITVCGNVVFHDKQEQLDFNSSTDISGWAAGPDGVNTAGWGLSLGAMDMAKIGQLYLNGGLWHGKQVVSSKWVADSTKEHSRWEKRGLSYGYLWWLGPDGHSFSAMGDGGNIIYVKPEKQMVVAIASLFLPNAKDRIELISNDIEPLFYR